MSMTQIRDEYEGGYALGALRGFEILKKRKVQKIVLKIIMVYIKIGNYFGIWET